MLLGAAGWQTMPGLFDFDFSHTVTVRYQSPAGALTSSVYGEFNNIGAPLPVPVPVPEPGAWSLMLAGLAATGWMVRRRRA